VKLSISTLRMTSR